MINLEQRWLELDIKINNADLLPIKVTGCEAISQPFEFDIVFVSTNQQISPSDLLGKAITVKLNSDPVRTIHGVVFNLKKITDNYHGYAKYQIKLCSFIEALKYQKNNQIYQELTAPQIIQKILSMVSHSAISLDNLTLSYPIVDYIVQYQETDYDFLHRILDQHGLFYYFEQQESKHVLILCDTNQSITINNTGHEHLSFSENTSSKQYLSHWQNNKALPPSKIKTSNIQSLFPSEIISSDIKLTDKSNQQIYNQFPDEVNYQSEADTRLKQYINSFDLNNNPVSIQSTYSHLSAGSYFTLSNNHGINFSNEEHHYFIFTIFHTIIDPLESSNSYLNHEHKYYKNKFIAFDNNINLSQILPKHQKDKFKIKSQTAIVTGPQKGDVYTDQYGRVKIKIFWDMENNNNLNTSCWCKVSHESAGNKRGTLWIPKVGDEVLVEFIYNQNNRPIVSDRLYNNINKEPYLLPNKQEKTGLTTVINDSGKSILNHELSFSDNENKPEIIIHSAGKKSAVIKDKVFYEAMIDSTENIKHHKLIKSNMGSGNITASKAFFIAGTRAITMDSASIIVQSD